MAEPGSPGHAYQVMATKARSDGSSPPRFEMTLPKTVIGLGLVSLFTDVSSEAIFPLLPAFLTTLGASNAFIGEKA